MPRARNTAVTAGLMAVAVALGGCTGDTAGHGAVDIGGQFEFHSPGGQTVITYDAADRAPIGDISGEALSNQGETISLADYDGQVVVLNTWGSWCAPCRSEAPELEMIQEKLQATGAGTMLGINVRDHARDAPQDFVDNFDVSYPSVYDPPFRTAAALGGIPTSVVPTTIVLDKQHRPAAVFLRQVAAHEVLDIALPLAEED